MVALGIVIALVLNSGGSDASNDETTPTRPSTIPTRSIGPSSVGTPGPPTLTPAGDGTALLEWTAPASLEDDEPPVFTIFRSDTPDPEPIDETTDTTFELAAELLSDADGQVCFRVEAKVLDTPSPLSDEVCHPADAAAGAGSPSPGTP